MRGGQAELLEQHPNHVVVRRPLGYRGHSVKTAGERLQRTGACLALWISTALTVRRQGAADAEGESAFVVYPTNAFPKPTPVGSSSVFPDTVEPTTTSWRVSCLGGRWGGGCPVICQSVGLVLGCVCSSVRDKEVHLMSPDSDVSSDGSLSFCPPPAIALWPSASVVRITGQKTVRC